MAFNGMVVSLPDGAPAPDEIGVRNGRGYTLSSGLYQVPGQSSLVVLFQNPAGSGRRIFLSGRLFNSSRVDSVGFGVSNPTTNLPTAVITPAQRGVGGASVAVCRVGVQASGALVGGGGTPVGNLIGGGSLFLGQEFTRTLEPGQSFANYVTNTTGAGLITQAADIYASLTIPFFEEPI